MSGACRWFGLLAALAALPAAAQQIVTYTDEITGPNMLVYGLPVPTPIDSLTPVDGFRSYAALEARLQALALASRDLAAHDIGRSSHNRVQWAYVASDEDGVDVEGRPEAAFFINATTHAREWGAPEVAAGTLEHLLAQADDGGIVRYVLDNTRVVVIPVHNVDGFLQTQRYPAQAILGADPEYPPYWPRDGRMRRKNMPGVDDVLNTFADHLHGIDLNRNHAPFWATSIGANGSSANPSSLTYHGLAQHSEVENLALERAAALGPVSRMRLGIDVHSFSKVFYSANTGRTRLNAIQSALIERLRLHHLQISGGKNYRDVPDPPNRGMGTASEYFAYAWLVPAWTLELEPSNGAGEYGGTSVTHGGFILPASEARRVRESWAQTHLIAFYRMAGPAHLARVRFFEVDGNRLAQQLRWRWDPATGVRVRERSGDVALRPGVRYRAELSFSKPMRYRNAAGAIVPIPGATTLPRTVDVGLSFAGGAAQALDTAAGAWLTDPAHVLRYRDDTFAFEFDAPAGIGDAVLSVATIDLAGLALDADPATVADWTDGAWSAYDSTVGAPGDIGGVDRVSAVFATAHVAPAPVQVMSTPPVVGEGDAARIVLRRATPEAGSALAVSQRRDDGEPGATVHWAAGEGGDKVLWVPIDDDTAIDGERTMTVALEASTQSEAGGEPVRTMLSPSPLRVLDNDSGGLRVLRAGARLRPIAGALASAAAESAPRAVVIDNTGVPLPVEAAATSSSMTVRGELALYGNHGTLALPDADPQQPYLFELDADAALRIDGARLVAVSPQSGARASLARGAGVVRIDRSRIGPLETVAPLLHVQGPLRVWRSVFDNVLSGGGGPAIAIAGDAEMVASTLTGPRGSRLQTMPGGTLRMLGSTAAHNLGVVLDAAQSGALTLGNTLLQDNAHGVIVGTPPPGWPPNCSVPAVSRGFNLEDGGTCELRGPADTRDHLNLGAIGLGLEGIAPTGSAIDGGATLDRLDAAGCSGVDQRGAPRPQTWGNGADLRCDIGAIEHGVNPHRGIWQLVRNGHGLDLQTVGNVLMLAWYTYTDDGQPTAYQAAAPLRGPRWSAPLQWSRRDPATGAISVQTVGQVAIDFVSDTEGTLRWRFDAHGVDGSEPMIAAAFDQGIPQFEVTGLWFSQGEAQYGATISRRGDTTALAMYYYDASGTIRWALGTGDAADALEMTMTRFSGFCPDCDADRMPVVAAPAGRVRVHFHTPERARLDIDLTSATGAWDTAPRTGVWFRPLSDLVDRPGLSATNPLPQ